MKNQFIQTLQRCSYLSEQVIVDQYHLLCEQYNQPTRHYHNLTHISAMLEHANRYQERLQLQSASHEYECDDSFNALVLAIYYHDVIYDVTPVETSTNTDSQHTDDKSSIKSNEQHSAEFFCTVFNDHLSTTLIDRVKVLILATEKHQMPDYDYLREHSLTEAHVALFLDIDLSILGQSAEIYQQYTIAIRQEYAHVGDSDYRQGRSEVLKRFINRDRLYFSEEFFRQYESQARVNMKNEINVLR